MGELADKQELVYQIQNTLNRHSEDQKRFIMKIQNTLDENSENINNIDYIGICNTLMGLQKGVVQIENINKGLCQRINTDVIFRFEHGQEREGHNIIVAKLHSEIDMNKLRFFWRIHLTLLPKTKE
jgi:hypothetical protein